MSIERFIKVGLVPEIEVKMSADEYENWVKDKAIPRIAEIKEGLENSLPHTRWTKRGLTSFLRHGMGINNPKLNDVDESGCANDHAFIVSIFENVGYMDIYYLNVPYGDEEIYITEVTVSDE